VREPIRITYFGYTCRVTSVNENTVEIAILELPYNVSKVPARLKEKVYYYLQAEGFIDIDTELL
jgi:hypothetical protein